MLFVSFFASFFRRASPGVGSVNATPIANHATFRLMLHLRFVRRLYRDC